MGVYSCEPSGGWAERVPGGPGFFESNVTAPITNAEKCWAEVCEALQHAEQARAKLAPVAREEAREVFAQLDSAVGAIRKKLHRLNEQWCDSCVHWKDSGTHREFCTPPKVDHAYDLATDPENPNGRMSRAETIMHIVSDE